MSLLTQHSLLDGASACIDDPCPLPSAVPFAALSSVSGCQVHVYTLFKKEGRPTQALDAAPALDAVVTLRRGARGGPTTKEAKKQVSLAWAAPCCCRPKKTDHILHTHTRRRILHISVSSQSSESTFKSKYQIRFFDCLNIRYKELVETLCQIDLFFGFICTHTIQITNSGHAAGYRRSLLRVGSVHLTGHNHQTHIRRQSEARHPGRRRWT